jgi:GntR family transcriptional regulator/MocR family aminotransferase
VIYAGTASKTLAPGLRLGWLVLPPRLASAVAEEKALDDGGSPVLDQLALAAMIGRHDLDRHVRAARQRYRRRRDRLVAVVERHAPAVRLRGIAAGLHALVTLPAGGPGETEALEEAARLDLALLGLGSCYASTRPPEPALVVGYATPPEHAYGAAVAALDELLSRLR